MWSALGIISQSKLLLPHGGRDDVAGGGENELHHSGGGEVLDQNIQKVTGEGNDSAAHGGTPGQR